MAVRKEMIHCFDGASQVVRSHAVRVEMPSRSVEEHEGGARLLLDVEIRVIVARRHDDDPVDAPVAKRADQLTLAVGILVAAAGEEENATLAGRVFDGAMKLRRERVGDVLEHESDRLSLSTETAERRRVRITPVVELLDRPLYSGLELRTDSGLGIDHARHRLQGDTGKAGDIDHRRSSRRVGDGI